MADADSAYNAKEYAKAISIYNELIEENGTSAPVLFNLGSAYYQAGDYGQAMLNYLRARRLDPGNEEINANLRYLQSRVEDANKAEQKGKHLKAGTDEPSFFQSVHASVAKDISSDTWGVWGAVCFICFLGCVALYIFFACGSCQKDRLFRRTDIPGHVVCVCDVCIHGGQGLPFFVGRSSDGIQDNVADRAGQRGG